MQWETAYAITVLNPRIKAISVIREEIPKVAFWPRMIWKYARARVRYNLYTIIAQNSCKYTL